MPPVLILRAETGEVDEISLPGLPLGTLLDGHYASRSVPISPGDCVLLMSDGFAELPDEQGEPLGYRQVATLFAESAGRDAAGVVEHLTKALEMRIGSEAPADDVTFVALLRL